MNKRAKDSPPLDRLEPPRGGATIRMYRQGLGDCFLLAFDREEKEPAYMLIDCGAHASQTGGRAAMTQIVENIVAVTGGNLDVVVATHEHADHLSGFRHEARRFIHDLKIQELWLGWTEDEDDPAAKRLRRGRTAAKRAIKKALDALQNQFTSRTALSLSQRVLSLESFFEMDTDEEDVGNEATRLGLKDPEKVSGNELAIALLKERAAVKPVRFLRPGHGPEAISGTSARAYVLGPPLEEALLKKSDPSAGNRKETYLSSVAGAMSFAAIGIDMATADESEKSGVERCFPFEERCRVKPHDPFFTEFYGLGDPNHREAWRQIEEQWLSTAAELALQLDSHTNNTSLVLAIELGDPGEGPILLFAADAQVGSWLSWRGLKWHAGRRQISVHDLLARTIVYKVGHHASHNATLRRDGDGQEYGLELMQDGCIALIPVDQQCADKLGWGMPHSKLYSALKRKSRGNILRSDNGHDLDVPATRIRFADVPGLNGARWRCGAETKDDGTPLYYDIEIQGNR
jgi:hypothetical protein